MPFIFEKDKDPDIDFDIHYSLRQHFGQDSPMSVEEFEKFWCPLSMIEKNNHLDTVRNINK